MRTPFVAVALATAMLAWSPAADAGHRGDDPLDEAFLPALVRLAPGGSVDVELVLQNADSRDVNATLRPFLSQTPGVTLVPLAGGTVDIPRYAMARVPFRAVAAEDAPPGVHEARVEIAHALGAAEATLLVAVGDANATLDAPTVRSEPVELVARVGASNDSQIVVANPSRAPRVLSLDVQNASGWSFEHAEPVIALPGGEIPLHVAFRPSAEAPNVTAARLVVHEGETEVANATLRLVVGSRVPLVEMRLDPPRLEVPLNGSATATLTLTNPADEPQWAQLDVLWPLTERFDVTFEHAAVELQPGETREVLVSVADTHGLPHEGSAPLTLKHDDGTLISTPWTLAAVGVPPEIPPSAPAGTAGGARPIATTPALATGALGLGALGLALAHRRWPLAFAALYARLRPSRMLEHPKRRALVELVRAEPGITMADAQRRLDLSNGQLAHHVRQLRQARILVVTRDGTARRLTLVGGGPVLRENVADRALAMLRERGTMRVREVADALGVSRQLAHHHLRRLHEAGLVRVQVERGRLLVSAAQA